MLYDKDNNAFDDSGFIFVAEGKCAKIFQKNDIALKSYKFDCPSIYYVSKDVFAKLKELDLETIVKLYNYYYFYKNNMGHIFKPRVYTMEYINNPNICLLDQDKEYLLDIMSKLERDIDILTKNKIKLFDAHYSNIIFLENGVKIIDIDLLRQYNLANNKKLLLHNKKELLYYIKSTLIHELKQEKLYNYKYELIFDFNSLINLSVTDYLNKIFKKDKIRNSLIIK